MKDLCRICHGAQEIMNDSGFVACWACGGSGFERVPMSRSLKQQREDLERSMRALDEALAAMNRDFGVAV